MNRDNTHLKVTIRKVDEMGMSDQYKKAWESIGEALSTQLKMIFWIAERTLSAKDFKEFVNEFAKKSEDNHDELLDFLSRKVGEVNGNHKAM